MLLLVYDDKLLLFRSLDILVLFLSRLQNNDVISSKAAKVLTRLSTNLHCLFPFFLNRHLSRMFLKLELLEDACEVCQFSQLRKLLLSVSENITLLAETGFGEGEICHRLVHPITSKTDKQSILISAVLLVRQRKMLDNILIRHDTLDTLLDILEMEDKAGEMFSHCVYSLSQLSGYLGVAVCCDRTWDIMPRGNTCRRRDQNIADDMTLICDDGSEVNCNKSVLCEASNVFAAMLTGSFQESEKTRVSLPHTSARALTCLVHFLYSCDPETCPEYEDLAADTLLELVALSDKYLLPELNLHTCHTCIKHAGSVKYVCQIYREALQSNFPVNCAGQ